MYYSLRKKREKRRNIKKSFFYILLTLFLACLIIFVGLKGLVKLINVITDVKKSNTISKSEDNLPPRTPSVNTFSEYTKDSTAEINGDAEPSSLVILEFAGDKSETVVGSDGAYLFKLDLSEGDNDFSLFSKDSAGNVSSSTKMYRIVFDKTQPKLEISTPADNSSFSGTSQKTVEVKGTTDADATLTLNDKYVYVSSDGTFIHKYQLTTGANKLLLKAVDQAGNEVTKEISVNYED